MVYLLLEGVLWLASEIVRRAGGPVIRKDAISAARMFLYYREAFHHKTECFAARIGNHSTKQVSSGFSPLLARASVGTVDQIRPLKPAEQEGRTGRAQT
jgi:hypothetical protein